MFIREEKYNGIYIEGLNEYIVENTYEFVQILKKGEQQRKIRSTTKNDFSSRSHTVFQISFETDKMNSFGYKKKAKINICDLAGSEKLDKDQIVKNAHFNEMVNINLSLSTLGKVIQSLANKRPHVPFRDSKLTRILQDSLGSNARTYLITTISQAE